MILHNPLAPPPACLFVVRLQPMAPAAPTAGPGATVPCIGQLEHVLSGRRHDFSDGASLLACLAHEQHQAQAAAAPLPGWAA